MRYIELTVSVCMVLHCGHISAVVLWWNLNTAITSVLRNFIFGYSKYYSVTEMLLALGLSSFDTVIHNYRKSFLYVWSKHSNDLVKLLRCVSPSAFFWLLLFYCTFFTYYVCLSVCMSVCVCVWAMLPDSNKMMMMTTCTSFVYMFTEQK